MGNKTKINIGPQHPSTHGVLRLVAELEGECVKNVEPVIGYLHRGMEKMAESRSYIQYLATVDRVDYLGGCFNSYAFCAAVEKLMNIELTERVQYIRVLTMELNRIASHLLWLGTFLLDLGATSPLFYTFRERDVILTLFEKLTGQRMMYNYYTFGGVKFDVSSQWLKEVEEFLKTMPEKLNDYRKIITENPIFIARCKNKGLIPAKKALEYSLTGVNLRSSGVDFDLRKQKPYLVYDKIDFNTVKSSVNDAQTRSEVRIKEIYESIKIIEQCIYWLNVNKEPLKDAKIKLTKVPEGETIINVESPRGECSCYLKSDGSDIPYRVKWRTGSYYAVQILPELLKGVDYQDIFPIFGSLDVILPEVDR